MSQHDMNIENQGFPAFRSDLNNALAALASTSAGATAPSTTFAQQLWYDSTANLLKMRNTDNDAWITLAYFDQTNDEWEVRSAVIQAVDSAGVVIKTDDGTTRLTIADGGDVTVANGLNVTGDLNADSGTLFVDASANNVGIGITSGDGKLHVHSSSAGTVTAATDANQIVLESTANVGMSFLTGNSSAARIKFGDPDSNSSGVIAYVHTDDSMRFNIDGTERMRIDSGGSLLFGGTLSVGGVIGTTTQQQMALLDGQMALARNGTPLLLNRIGVDGGIVQIRQNAIVSGEIAAKGNDLMLGTADTAFRFRDATDSIEPANVGTLGSRDNAIDLGASGVRFDDIYATNGTIQTSDRNEKQDIQELSEAEQRVAVAAKAMMRKFRWKDAVAEKGDDARIHFGIIAQDLQAAFEAEGLDAGRYAMFISSTWWETQTEVPAVEAQDAVYETVTIPAEYDEDGNEITPETTEERLVSEAVEAQEAYTRTDTYNTAEEAPEGAVERTRLGVRYPELLAFIIAAI